MVASFLSWSWQDGLGDKDWLNIEAAHLPTHGEAHLANGAWMSHSLPTSFVSSHPFMLVSGVTAREEQCLVASGGESGVNGAELALEPCAQALRSRDGRELFSLQQNGQLVTAVGHKCVALAREEEDGGHRNLELAPCDGRSFTLDSLSWRLTPQNRLKAMSLPKLSLSTPAEGGDEEAQDLGLCLSLGGSGLPGAKDVARDAQPWASSSADRVAHTPEQATDGKDTTYWASGIDPEEPVILQVNFEKQMILNGIDIKWECPAEHYSVETFVDGGWVSRFTDQSLKSLRQTDMTHVALDGVKAAAVRVVMNPPAPRCDTGHGRRLFAIQQLSVLSPRRQPQLDPCEAPGGDARSRWFLSHVDEFQPCRRFPEYHRQFL